MNNEKVYDLSLRKISYVREHGKTSIEIDACLKTLGNCICDYFKNYNLKTLIVQTPLNFMDIFRPCCIMIRKNKDNEQVQIKAISNNIQTFPFKGHVTTHPIETMLRDVSMFKYMPNMDVYEIECDTYGDMYAEILRILKSEYHDSLYECYIESSEQYFRIIYESKEYEDIHIHTPGYYAGIDNTDREWTPFDVTNMLLSSTNTPEEKQTMKQISEDLKMLSEDMNDHRYSIYVSKDGIIKGEHYPLFIRTDDNRKIFNYKCLRELITDDSEISIDISYGTFSIITGVYKPYEMSISATTIIGCRKAKSDTESPDPTQNTINLHSTDYDKLNHIWITINK